MFMTLVSLAVLLLVRVKLTGISKQNVKESTRVSELTIVLSALHFSISISMSPLLVDGLVSQPYLRQSAGASGDLLFHLPGSDPVILSRGMTIAWP
jgi:hypothetical protein